MASGRRRRRTGSRRPRRAPPGSRSADSKQSRAGWAAWVAPARRGHISPSPRRATRIRASDDLQGAVVDGNLRAHHLDGAPLAVVDLDAERRQLDLLAARGLQADAADAGRVVQGDAVAAVGLEHHLLVGRRQQDRRDLGHRSPPAARPDRVIGVALLELDPDAGADRRQREEPHAAAAERGARHRPAAFVVAHDVGHLGLDSPQHERVLDVGNFTSVLAVEWLAHGLTTGVSVPVPSRLSVKVWVALFCWTSISWTTLAT